MTLLGVLLFGARSGSTRLGYSVRIALEDTLEGAAPVFHVTETHDQVRSAVSQLDVASVHQQDPLPKSAAVDMRRHGLLPHELEQDQLKERSARLKRLRSGSKASSSQDLLSRDASGLAGDYAALA